MPENIAENKVRDGGEIRGKDGASEGIRTLDINLGKVALYQTELRSLPEERR